MRPALDQPFALQVVDQRHHAIRRDLHHRAERPLRVPLLVGEQPQQPELAHLEPEPGQGAPELVADLVAEPGEQEGHTRRDPPGVTGGCGDGAGSSVVLLAGRVAGGLTGLSQEQIVPREL